MKISLAGVIGCGAVGTSTIRVLSNSRIEVLCYDIDHIVRKSIKDLRNVKFLMTDLDDLRFCEAIFICVPLNALEENIEQLIELENIYGSHPKVIIQRTTTCPGTASSYASRFKRWSYSVNPCFISRDSLLEDESFSGRIVYSGDNNTQKFLEELYSITQCPRHFKTETHEAAEFLKFIDLYAESILISLWNELLTISDHISIKRGVFLNLMAEFVREKRFSTCLRVPGKAFSSSCLENDLSIFLSQLNDGSVHNMADAMQKTNSYINSNYGLNEYTSDELYIIEDGRIMPTVKAVNLLLQGDIDHANKSLSEFCYSTNKPQD